MAVNDQDYLHWTSLAAAQILSSSELGVSCAKPESLLDFYGHKSRCLSDVYSIQMPKMFLREIE